MKLAFEHLRGAAAQPRDLNRGHNRGDPIATSPRGPSCRKRRCPSWPWSAVSPPRTVPIARTLATVSRKIPSLRLIWRGAHGRAGRVPAGHTASRSRVPGHPAFDRVRMPVGTFHYQSSAL